MRHMSLLRSAIAGTRRLGALGLFKASRCLLRGGISSYQHKMISRGGMRIALSGASLLERGAVILLFGSRSPNKSNDLSGARRNDVCR